MTATYDFNRLLESVLDTNGPQSVPSNVVDAALTRSRDVGQRRPRLRAMDRRGWPAGRAAPFTPPSMRLLILALIATALVGLSVIGSALIREDQTPKLIESQFVRTFEYRLPVESAMRVSGPDFPEMVAWVDGPDIRPIASDETVGSGQPSPWQWRGVVIGSGEDAWTHAVDGSTQGALRDARSVAWSPDGTELAFVHQTGPNDNPDVPGAPATIEVASADGADRRQVAGPSGDFEGFDIVWATN